MFQVAGTDNRNALRWEQVRQVLKQPLWFSGEQRGACHAGGDGSAVARSPGTPPEMLGAAAAETSAKPARLSQSSMGTSISGPRSSYTYRTSK